MTSKPRAVASVLGGDTLWRERTGGRPTLAAAGRAVTGTTVALLVGMPPDPPISPPPDPRDPEPMDPHDPPPADPRDPTREPQRDPDPQEPPRRDPGIDEPGRHAPGQPEPGGPDGPIPDPVPRPLPLPEVPPIEARIRSITRPSALELYAIEVTSWAWDERERDPVLDDRWDHGGDDGWGDGDGSDWDDVGLDVIRSPDPRGPVEPTTSVST